MYTATPFRDRSIVPAFPVSARGLMRLTLVTVRPLPTRFERPQPHDELRFERVSMRMYEI